ncbi:hypothetical protein PGB90_002034 [Kerria lacca]
MEDIQSLPAKRQRLNEKCDIRLSTCDFREILESDFFVDKTMLIKEVLCDVKDIIVTASKKFGKSTNLSMLKLFLMIEVDESGERITKSIKEPVRDTKNYQLFTNPIPKLPGRKLKISEEIEILNKHLGKYPVIYVDFNCKTVQSLDNVVEKCKNIIHKTYLEHKYLCNSKKLDVDEKYICKKWCSKTEYKLTEVVDVSQSLYYLSKFLFNHFNHKCFVLVDNYDSKSSKFQVENTTYYYISKVRQWIFEKLFDGNERIYFSFSTGISSLIKFNDVYPYPSLQGNKFKNFYGLTVDEIMDFEKRLSFRKGEFENLIKYCNNDEQDRKKIFNIWSFISYVKFRKIKHFWSDSEIVKNLIDMSKILEIQFCLNTLLSYSDNTTAVDFLEKVCINQISKVKEMLLNDLANSCIRFNFLLQNNYFAICNINENTRKVIMRISNNQSRYEIERKLQVHYEWIYKLNFYTLDHCFIHWNVINFDVEDTIRDNLNKICKILNIIFKSILLLGGNEATFHI